MGDLNGRFPAIVEDQFSRIQPSQRAAVVSLPGQAELFGRPEQVCYEAKRADNGVDIDGKLLLTYPDLTCEINTSKSTDIPCGCYVEGSNGWVRQQGLVNSFENCSARLNGVPLDVERQNGEHRMIYELARFRDAILQRDEKFFEKMASQSQTASWVLEKAQRK